MNVVILMLAGMSSTHELPSLPNMWSNHCFSHHLMLMSLLEGLQSLLALHLSLRCRCLLRSC